METFNPRQAKSSLVKRRQFVVPGSESTPQESFFGEASGSVAPCQQLSQARNIVSFILNLSSGVLLRVFLLLFLPEYSSV